MLGVRPESSDTRCLEARADIAAALQQFQPLKIRPSDIKNDLFSYISTGVRSIPNIDERRARTTIKVLSKKASGMFIWVRLVIELSKDAATPSEFDKFLAKIPRGLHQIYCLVVERLDKRLSLAPPSRRHIAKNIFCWLAIAPKAISIEAMREALAFSATDSLPERHGTKSKPNRVPDALTLLRPSSKSVFSICATLVDHDEIQGTLRLLHHTAREFLTEAQDDWERSVTV
ncbi:hypothetical protein GGR53DRAFT_465562 [Hypoxylon sp. FL1150]|nr:hypothetical protein GGR53DRAFT_465562 [Hypoxylon sp. FL1150]